VDAILTLDVAPTGGPWPAPPLRSRRSRASPCMSSAGVLGRRCGTRRPRWPPSRRLHEAVCRRVRRPCTSDVAPRRRAARHGGARQSLQPTGLVLCAIVPVADVELARLAFTDPVTGIANRHALDRDLDHALARSGRCVGLLHVGLDRFKKVNDRLGHCAGDAVRQSVGARLRDTVRAHDPVARVGGDEFVVALTDLDPPGRGPTLAVARHVEQALAEPGRRRRRAGAAGGERRRRRPSRRPR